MIFAWILAAALAEDALRDGLYEVARREAATATNSEEIVMESYAREHRWQDLLDHAPTNDVVTSLSRYYRSLANLRLGRLEVARELLTDTDFLPLKAELEIEKGDYRAAVSLMEKIPDPPPEVQYELARCAAHNGDSSRAQSIWRQLALNGEVPLSLRAAAVVHLNEVEALKTIYEALPSGKDRHLVGLRLGRTELENEDKDVAKAGERLIREIAHEDPGFNGACEAMLAVADAELKQGDFAAAARDYRQILSCWPETDHNLSLYENLSQAEMQQNHHEEGLDCLLRLETLSTNREEKALAMVKVGDALTDMGRGEEALSKYRAVQSEFGETAAAKQVQGLIELRQLDARGREAYRAFRFEEARQDFLEVAQKDATLRPQMMFFEALCLYGLGKDTEARNEATELLNTIRKPGLKAQVALWLAKFNYNEHLWSEAVPLFLLYVELDPSGEEAPAALLWAARATSAQGDHEQTIKLVSQLMEAYPKSPLCASGMLLQGRSLIELARFDEAVLVLDRAAALGGISEEELQHIQIIRADALFAMGADNPGRYRQALEGYRALWMKENFTPSLRLQIAFKIGRTLEKLGEVDGAITQYYTSVLQPYERGVHTGVVYDDDARSAFTRAAFNAADIMLERGLRQEAVNVLDFVVRSGLPAAETARQRIRKLEGRSSYYDLVR